MKTYLLPILALCLCLFNSCSDDNEDDGLYADYLVARPITITKAEFEDGVQILPPRTVEESGKIYAYENLIFINDKYKGVHVIDNSNPSSPQPVTFIKIAGNVDISVKDNYLYADSLTDLIVLDISDLNNIRIVNRLQGVLGDHMVWPAEVDIYDHEEIDYENEILMGWEVDVERRLKEDTRLWQEDAVFMAMAADGNVGQGGSLARFKIVSDFLYAVDSHSINIFDISNLENPVEEEQVYAGFDIETIFYQNNMLFLGSMRGMYIYGISDPARPEFISEFQHGTACDPVVVDGDYAYVTLRGGNGCGATESGLFIIDVANPASPSLEHTYPMDEPYGLGIRGNLLFVCDGASGLRVFDKTDVANLVEVNHMEDMITYDVIPLEQSLLLVGDATLYQFEYLENDIRLISTLRLD